MIADNNLVAGGVAGDLNQVSKPGKAGSISNMFDQRISDGLTDLLAGATGIRTSSIPDISKEVVDIRNANKTLRVDPLANEVARYERPLKFPQKFATENDENGQMQNYIHFHTIERRSKADNDKQYDIFLYVPNTMTDGTAIDYESGEKGIVEGILSKLIGGNKGDQGIKETVIQTVTDQLRGSIGQAIKGEVINPMKFQLFKGVGPRSFSYSFELYPENQKDSEKIREICYAFKISSLPGIVAGTGNKVYTFPNEWGITYHGPMKDWIDYPMVSVLTKVDVDYNLAGNARYYDGAPAAVKLDLSFTEVFTLDRVKYDQRVSALVDNGRGLRENTQEGGSYADVMGLENPHMQLGSSVSGTDRSVQAGSDTVTGLTGGPRKNWTDDKSMKILGGEGG